MRLLIALIVLTLPLAAAAVDLGPRASAKPAGGALPPPPDPDVVRQGGDTMADAIPLPIPTLDLAGTTTGYTDDYDPACPFDFSHAPDVVYSITPETDRILDIDLCGSSYDTKLFIYDEAQQLVACNDDFYPPGNPCGDFVSRLPAWSALAGRVYYLVIDGYDGAHGEYRLTIRAHEPCHLSCPSGGIAEGEPPLTVDYVDQFNGGCASDPDNPDFAPLDASRFCGVSGYFTTGMKAAATPTGSPSPCPKAACSRSPATPNSPATFTNSGPVIAPAWT